MNLIDVKDGSLLSVAAGEPARAWDIQTGRLIGEFGTPVDTSLDGNWVGATFHPTEPILYAEVDADQIGIFTLDSDELMEIARSRLSRDLTEEECQLYLRRTLRRGRITKFPCQSASRRVSCSSFQDAFGREMLRNSPRRTATNQYPRRP